MDARRREALKYLLEFSAGSWLGPLLLSAGTPAIGADPALVVTGESGPRGIGVWVAGANSAPSRLIELDFFPHSVLQKPGEPYKLFLVEKASYYASGRNAAEVDLHQNAVTRKIYCEGGKKFYGHAVFHGDELLTSEQVDARIEGRITVRSASDYRMLESLPSYGNLPHDIRVLGGGKTIVVLNCGLSNSDVITRERQIEDSNIAWIDRASGRLLEQVYFGVPNANVAHFCASADGWLVLAGGSDGHDTERPSHNPSLLYTVDPGGNMKRLAPAALHSRLFEGHLTSVCLDEKRGIAAMCARETGNVTFWSYKTGEMLRHLAMEMPAGIDFYAGAGRYVVNSSSLRKRFFIDGETLRIEESPSLESGTGAHLRVFRV